MKHMADRRSGYLSYLLRLWQEKSQDELIWRASLEKPGSGERLGFKDLENLFLYLNRRVAQMEKDTDPGRNVEGEG